MRCNVFHCSCSQSQSRRYHMEPSPLLFYTIRRSQSLYKNSNLSDDKLTVDRERKRTSSYFFYIFFSKIQFKSFTFGKPKYRCTLTILNVNTYIPLTLYRLRGSRGISDIPPRHPRFTKIS
jgi:hypothetical protein